MFTPSAQSVSSVPGQTVAQLRESEALAMRRYASTLPGFKREGISMQAGYSALALIRDVESGLSLKDAAARWGIEPSYNSFKVARAYLKAFEPHLLSR